jgi:hypothetical protein
MSDHGGVTTLRLQVELTPAEHAALAAAATQLELSAPALARLLILHCLDRLVRGDAELQRAVKGSRDAGCR